jgi:outer membrane protein
MKKIIIAAAVGMLVAGQVAAQETPWLVRVRAAHLDMANKGATNPDLALSVNDKTIPELDVSYFFNKNVAAELVLAVPQKQVVSAGGAAIGTFNHLPPTLTLQYHFTDLKGYKPYVGAGLNYTKITNVNLTTGHTLDNDTWGTAFQAGVDIPLTKQISFNLDVKKVHIKTNVYASNGANGGVLKLDPVIVGVGVGYRF